MVVVFIGFCLFDGFLFLGIFFLGEQRGMKCISEVGKMEGS